MHMPQVYVTTIPATLRRQIDHCNSLVNKHKSNYYRNLVGENAQDLKTLWHFFCSALHFDPQSALPSHESQESLTAL